MSSIHTSYQADLFTCLMLPKKSFFCSKMFHSSSIRIRITHIWNSSRHIHVYKHAHGRLLTSTHRSQEPPLACAQWNPGIITNHSVFILPVWTTHYPHHLPCLYLPSNLRWSHFWVTWLITLGSQASRHAATKHVTSFICGAFGCA